MQEAYIEGIIAGIFDVSMACYTGRKLISRILSGSIQSLLDIGNTEGGAKW